MLLERCRRHDNYILSAWHISLPTSRPVSAACGSLKL
ncbi:hypothetical protein FHX49_000668 [Microbacterium endophyticum]|uniref:Uncharacterized protein n=1 Tax=Microbacterium endophyticum TaxID=1526412 RepID=A0A7W4YMH6_9MICO|nr:hypothetical protein [Microbacterium endophyticum]NIK37333.1 hypothetical protein [Microbacterium endophyticum]